MPWRPMPPNTRPSVATAQSWPNAPAADGRTSCARFQLNPQQVAEAPLSFVSYGPGNLATHGVAFPCRATSADRLPAVGAAPVDAPARVAPELAHPRQDRPTTLWPARQTDSPAWPVAGVRPL